MKRFHLNDKSGFFIMMIAWMILSCSDQKDIEGQMDLALTSLGINSITSRAITYNFTIKNTGSVPVGLQSTTGEDITVLIAEAYVSSDNTFSENSDASICEISLCNHCYPATLAPGDSFNIMHTDSLSIDLNSVSYLFLTIDSKNSLTESDETNNIRYVAIDPCSSGDCPDLVISSLAITYWSSYNISYEYTVTNIGNATANLTGPTGESWDIVDISAYLSADSISDNAGDIDACGAGPAFWTLKSLAPGESFTELVTCGPLDNKGWGVDPSVNPYLVMMVDWYGLLPESDESNNTKVVAIPDYHCLDGYCPDLVITSVKIIKDNPAKSLEFEYTIENAGDGSVWFEGPSHEEEDNVSVAAFLSADPVFDIESDLLLEEKIVTSSPAWFMGPGNSATLNFSTDKEFDLLTTPYLIVYIDCSEIIFESDENNNYQVVAINDDPCKGNSCPDLVVKSLEVRSWTETGITWAYTIANIGDAPVNFAGPTSAENDNLYIQGVLSADTIFNIPGDIGVCGNNLGYPTATILYPGETFSGQISCGSGGNLSIDPEQTPYLVMKVDRGHTIDESNEYNNTLAVKLE